MLIRLQKTSRICSARHKKMVGIHLEIIDVRRISVDISAAKAVSGAAKATKRAGEDKHGAERKSRVGSGVAKAQKSAGLGRKGRFWRGEGNQERRRRQTWGRGYAFHAIKLLHTAYPGSRSQRAAAAPAWWGPRSY